jgi:hypothetical protein
MPEPEPPYFTPGNILAIALGFGLALWLAALALTPQ